LTKSLLKKAGTQTAALDAPSGFLKNISIFLTTKQTLSWQETCEKSACIFLLSYFCNY